MGCQLLLDQNTLPGSCYGVQIEYAGLIVGMGRIIGYGALNFEIVDIAVDPDHQGNGLGRKIIQNLMSWFERHVSPGAYITLVADVPELYEKFGFKTFVRQAKEWHWFEPVMTNNPNIDKHRLMLAQPAFDTQQTNWPSGPLRAMNGRWLQPGD